MMRLGIFAIQLRHSTVNLHEAKDMLIAGTGGMGKEVLGGLLTYENHDDICFFDEDQNSPDILYDKFKVLKSFEDVELYFNKKGNLFITAIGHPRLREKLTDKIEKTGGKLASMICPDVFLFPFNETYNGLIAYPGAGISHGVEIGKSCVMHLNSSIGHEVAVGKFMSLGPGAEIIGPTTIGDYVFIGANATVLPDAKVGNNAIIGAGAVVRKDIGDNETFLG